MKKLFAWGSNTRTTDMGQRRKGLAALLMIACTLGIAVHSQAQTLTPPTTPTLITPPEGSTGFLVGHALGTQGYVCLPTSEGASTASWTVNNARPEATLFTDVFGQQIQIITHFLSPNTHPNKFAPSPLAFGNATWQSSFDSSKVWAQTVHAIPPDANTPSCPNTGSIACLLLQVIGADQGPAGGKFLTQTSFIQRLNTKGGSAPATGCSVSSDVGKQALVPYSADYFFFRGGVE
ncbi:MAG TPA: DUF3455 domain-containing protein [Terriglobales bacterium]|nr:DUF3455 domain-containing protein [Terriglobales bacterium]